MDREYRRRTYDTPKKNNLLSKLVSQSVVSIMVLVCIFSLQTINSKQSDVLIKNIKNQLYYSVDYKTATKKIVSKVKSFKNTNLKDNDKNDIDKKPEQPTSTDKII